MARPEDLRLYSFSAEALRLLRDKGFLIILITNQSGIRRGFLDEQTLFEIHKKLEGELKIENVKLDAIYYCPHLPSDDCMCRKPKPGMIMQANRDFQIDLKNSWTIGDKETDIEAGSNAGTKTAMVLTGYGNDEIQKSRITADLVGKNLLEVAKLITGKVA